MAHLGVNYIGNFNSFYSGKKLASLEIIRMSGNCILSSFPMSDQYLVERKVQKMCLFSGKFISKLGSSVLTMPNMSLL